MKKNIFIVLIAIICIGFSSCETEDYWVSSYLDMELLVRSDNSGYFENSPVEYRLSDLSNINNATSSVSEIYLQDGFIDVYGSFYAGDKISALEIWVEGVGSYVCPADFFFSGSTTVLRINERTAPGYNRFMQNVMNKLTSSGRIRVSVSGYFNSRGVILDFILKNTLDVRVR